MSGIVPGGQDAELKRRRTEILRGLTEMNSLNLGVVVLVGALAVVAILLGLKAREDAQKLWSASVTQARASRFGGEIGWKSNALTAISRASEVRPSAGLRNEAIAALMTPDIELAGGWFRHPWQENTPTISPNLSLIALRREKAIEVVELQKGTRTREFKMDGNVASMLFDESGHYLAARDVDGRLRVWDVGSGAEMVAAHPEKNERTFDTMAFAGDQILVGLPGGRLQFYSVTTGDSKAQAMIETGFEFMWFVTDVTGTALAGTQLQTIQIWDLKNGKRRAEFEAPAKISSLAMSRDGKHVAVGSENSKVYLWRVADGEMQTLSAHQGLVFSVAFDPTGRLLASDAFGGTARIWDVASGVEVLGTETMFIHRFGTEGSLLACSRADAGFGLARISEGTLTRSIRLPSQTDPVVHWVSFSSENRLITTQSGAAQILDLESGEVLATAAGQRFRAGYLDEGAKALYTTGTDGFQRWKVETNETGYAIKNPETIQAARGLPNEVMRLSGDGTEALLRIGLAGAVLYDLKNKKGVAGFPVANVGAIALSADKQRIATGTFHGEGTKVWGRDGKVIKDLGGRDAGVEFSPDGKWLATVASDLCAIWDTRNWEAKHRYSMNSASGLPGIPAFSPDGKMLAFTVMRRSVKIVDPVSGVELMAFGPVGEHQLNSLTFSPSGDRLVAGTQLGTVEVWNVAAMRRELAALKLKWPDGGKPLPEGYREQNAARWAPVIAGVTLAMVLCFSLVSWIRQRQFVAIYGQVEADMEQRNEQLAMAQHELFQSQKMRALGTLAAGIAHDFNNLLSIIKLSNQLTAENTRENEEAQDNARIIERAVKQGKSVVKSMLGYSRNAANQADYSVNEVVEQTVALLRQEFLKNVALTVETAGDLQPVFGTQNCLEQVLLNLIVNAVEAMKGGGRLSIATRRVELAETKLSLRPGEAIDYVEVRVADSGPGIPGELITRIFEPFFTTKNIGNERGTGLGLSLVYGICKEEGIGIAVKSEVGAGTEFRLYVPAAGKKRSMLPKKETASVGL